MNRHDPSAIKGRGTEANPPNRFEPASRSDITDSDWSDGDEEASSPQTRFLPDASRSILSYNASPDVGFEASINPYRGCEHGCVYCYARPTHEYLGFSSGLDFETNIMVKEKASDLLREELSRKSWIPKVVAMSGVTDPYQPVEKRLQLTRKCLEVLLEFKNPVVIITKNHLVTRDRDILSALAKDQLVAVFISITTLDRHLCGILEPRTSRPDRKLKAISELAEAGIPTGVMAAPVIPGLTDSEIPKIIEAASLAGARFAGMVPLRLPYAVAPLFEEWLEKRMPERKNKIINRIKAMRGGALNDPKFGSRMSGEGVFAEQIQGLFAMACKKSGVNREEISLSTGHFRPPSGAQLSLFK